MMRLTSSASGTREKDVIFLIKKRNSESISNTNLNNVRKAKMSKRIFFRVKL